MSEAAIRLKMPGWAKPYRRPARYKVAHGGRGSGKSWAFARLILLRVVSSTVPLRVLCARELQNSIKDSVHKLLSDQIDAMELTDHFDVGESYIRCVRNGSEFLFKGLRHNSTEIKSMENIGLCWVEEAQGVSESSWKLLIPTVRAPGSEIWITFNPENETDPTYQRFVVSQPPNSIVREVNWRDNPWFPPELEAERLHMQATDPDSYDWIWEGKCRRISDAQVLRGKWFIEAFMPGAGWDGPYFGADWGFATDPTVLTKSWIHDGSLHIEHEAYAEGVENDDLAELFDRIPGSRQHLIRGDSSRPETISHLARRGFKIIAARKWPGSVEDGVLYLRGFRRIVIHPRCAHAAQEARDWSYKVDRLTKQVLPVLADGSDHCWDSIRYALDPLIARREYGITGLKVQGL